MPATQARGNERCDTGAGAAGGVGRAAGDRGGRCAAVPRRPLRRGLPRGGSVLRAVRLPDHRAAAPGGPNQRDGVADRLLVPAGPAAAARADHDGVPVEGPPADSAREQAPANDSTAQIAARSFTRVFMGTTLVVPCPRAVRGMSPSCHIRAVPTCGRRGGGRRRRRSGGCPARPGPRRWRARRSRR